MTTRKSSDSKWYSPMCHEEVLMKGMVVKSPPFPKMNNESSYKERWMELVRVDAPDVRRVTDQHVSTSENKRTFSQGRRVSATSMVEESQTSTFFLRYWESEEHKIKGKQMSKDPIELKKTFSVVEQAHPRFPDKYPNTFALNTTGRNYFFNAPNEEMEHKWYEQISWAIKNAETKYDSVIIPDEQTTKPNRQSLRIRKNSAQPRESSVIEEPRQKIADHSHGNPNNKTRRSSSIDSGTVPDMEITKHYVQMTSPSNGHSPTLPPNGKHEYVNTHDRSDSIGKADPSKGLRRSPPLNGRPRIPSLDLKPQRSVSFDGNNNCIITPTSPTAEPIYSELVPSSTFTFFDVTIEFPAGSKISYCSDGMTLITEKLKVSLSKLSHV